MNSDYNEHVAQRTALGIPPLPLSESQTDELCQRLSNGESDAELWELLFSRIPAGVSPAAKRKATFLGDILLGKTKTSLSPVEAAFHLGRMLGGYCVSPLVEALSSSDSDIAKAAEEAMSRLFLVGDASNQVAELAKKGSPYALRILQKWAKKYWIFPEDTLPDSITLLIYKVDGEINTDALSPAPHAGTRPDIPLHALSMGETRFPDGIAKIAELRKKAEVTGIQVAFATDTLGTGSSRKSATNSLLWHIGEDIPAIPNKRRRGIAIAEAIAPIFRDTMEDSGALPLTMSVQRLHTGQKIHLVFTSSNEEKTFKITDDKGELLGEGSVSSDVLESWKSGGRIPKIIGNRLAAFAQETLASLEGKSISSASEKNISGDKKMQFTLAQKIIGKACGREGVSPGESCFPKVTTAASQDTTGPMTRNELEDLACLTFSAPFVLQSFCHTVAYPTDKDKNMHKSLAEFWRARGGLALKPGDGIIHAWLNHFLLPDTVGTGGDSHTRFPIGISFPGGSGLVAFAAAQGFMPLTMPESVSVRFTGHLPTGITWRDIVNAIPLKAIEKGMLDRPGSGQNNIFNGRIMELEGFPEGTTTEEAFELTNASAERSAAAAVATLPLEETLRFLRSNAGLIRRLLSEGYGNGGAEVTLQNRLTSIEAYLSNPSLLKRDIDAEYAAVLDICLTDIQEPIVACPNHPDLVEPLSNIAGRPIDEVFIGSCMTSYSHFKRSALLLKGNSLKVKRLWISPPTRMDKDALEKDGSLDILRATGARIEIPGCSLCMGNQARVADNAVVFSTSTRNFDNRLGAGARVYLGSAELGAIVARLGRIPTCEEYFEIWHEALDGISEESFSPLDFSESS